MPLLPLAHSQESLVPTGDHLWTKGLFAVLTLEETTLKETSSVHLLHFACHQLKCQELKSCVV